MGEINVEELLAKANEPKRLALKWHPYYRGKVEVSLKGAVTGYQDFSVWYTPGVAEPCREIHKNRDLVYEHTNKGNFVAVVSDGTRVLGLGNIGPWAAMPVMEGKAMLFKYLGGVDAFPICVDTKTGDELIELVKQISPTFGGINLEDIEKPKCFYVLERLRNEAEIPVWHDDQQGTALVTMAGFLGALKVVNKRIEDVTVAFIGVGAANTNNYKYLTLAGLKPENAILVDSKGILNRDRDDLKDDPIKWEMCQKTNGDRRKGGIEEALVGVDACISLSRSGPGTINKEWVKKMAKDAIFFACANPIPEIWPWEAKEVGVRVVATGRSDFPNQVNNSLGFPAVFRGALDVAATKITDEMCVAASQAIVSYAEKKGLSEEYIIPDMGETEMFIEEAVAVGMKAIEQGVAKKKMTKDELEKVVREKIEEARKKHKVLRDAGLIPDLPK